MVGVERIRCVLGNGIWRIASLVDDVGMGSCLGFVCRIRVWVVCVRYLLPLAVDQLLADQLMAEPLVGVALLAFDKPQLTQYLLLL